MKEYAKKLEKELLKHENPTIAAQQTAYMKNKFEHIGLKMPERRKITTKFIKEYGKPEIEDLFDLIKALWKNPYRDLQHFGLDLVEKYMKKFRKEDLAMLEFMILNKSWWDTVDMVAAKHSGMYFRLYPEKIVPVTEKWIKSENKWLQRSALLFQLKYKQDTNIPLLFDYILRLKDSKEFFIRKAIGWVLREYSKTNSELVISFVEENRLSPLSEREALKWLKTNTDII